MKTQSSSCTPMLKLFERRELLNHREMQEHMKKVMRSAYSREYTDYVCVDVLGKLYDPDFITEHFRQLLKKHKLKKIHFHDLRHSCASVLLAQSVSMKQIQEWLGHSDMSTTANIYSHLDAVSKTETGVAMSKALRRNTNGNSKARSVCFGLYLRRFCRSRHHNILVSNGYKLFVFRVCFYFNQLLI